MTKKHFIVEYEQRLKQCTPYVFASVAFIEEKQLERNIGISYCKGKKSVSENGDRSYTLDEGFAVLDNVKGTPRAGDRIGGGMRILQAY